MVDIEIYENEAKGRYAISVKGHAQYAEPGRDIVCAAVSGLLQSLGNYIEERADDYGWHILEIKYDSGDLNIEALDESTDSNLWHLFKMIAEGLEDIAKMYPANVKIYKKN